MAFFNSQKFEKDSNTSPAYVRASDAYANKRGAWISFYHVPSKTPVYFKAFITTYNESYNSDWAPEVVYGRVDPIYLFKNTTRKISLAFKIPAETESEAFENLGRVQKLIQFLYPNYTELPDASGAQSGVFAQTISQSPMVRIKVMNLLMDVKGAQDISTAPGGPGHGDFDFYTTAHEEGGPGLWMDAAAGQLGVIDNLVVNHNLEGPDGVHTEGMGIVLPKMIDINIGFSPIHEHPIGWSDRKEIYKDENQAITQTSQPFHAMFPYAINLQDGHPHAGIEHTLTPEAIAASSAISGDGTESLDAGADAAASPQGTQSTAPELSDAQIASAHAAFASTIAGVTNGSPMSLREEHEVRSLVGGLGAEMIAAGVSGQDLPAYAGSADPTWWK